ncbi:hypothetical protein CRYUN_Cryun23aG0013800 [Craigia yunnanensis]
MERRKICFRDMIKSCGLNDVQFQGQKYTWYGVREGELVKKRMDRVLVNLEWLEEFHNIQVINLPVVGSDHSLIVMNTD